MKKNNGEQKLLSLGFGSINIAGRGFDVSREPPQFVR